MIAQTKILVMAGLVFRMTRTPKMQVRMNV
jgi:hypothetical protein